MGETDRNNLMLRTIIPNPELRMRPNRSFLLLPSAAAGPFYDQIFGRETELQRSPLRESGSVILPEHDSPSSDGMPLPKPSEQTLPALNDMESDIKKALMHQ